MPSLYEGAQLMMLGLCLVKYLGQDGGVYIAADVLTTPSNGKVFCAIQVLTDATVTTTGNIELDKVALDAGTIICGRFTSIKLEEGKVIAYKGG